MKNDNPFNFSKICFYHSNIPPEHPMYKCRFKIFMPYVHRSLVREYKIECMKTKIWDN